MTSEPDSTPRRRPPTIDLTAKEVEPETPSSTQESAADAAEDRTTHKEAPGEPNHSNFLARVSPYAVGALVGAVVLGAIMAGFWMVGVFPPQQTAAAPGAQGAKAASTDEISSRLDKIQQALQAPRADQALAARVAAAEAQTKSLGDSLAALNRRLDEVAAASQSALAQAKTAAAAATDAMKNAARTGVEQSDIDALNNRIAALESTMKSLSTERAADAERRRSRGAVDGRRRGAACRGRARCAIPGRACGGATLGADQTATAPLEPFAADGLPNAAALAHEFALLTPSLLQASGAAPRESSFLGNLEAHAQKLVRITPIEAPAGDDPSSVIARINIDAARGDIAAALAGIARLPESARALAASWVKKAEAREAAIAASRRIAADALAAIGRPAPQ